MIWVDISVRKALGTQAWWLSLIRRTIFCLHGDDHSSSFYYQSVTSLGSNGAASESLVYQHFTLIYLPFDWLIDWLILLFIWQRLQTEQGTKDVRCRNAAQLKRGSCNKRFSKDIQIENRSVGKVNQNHDEGAFDLLRNCSQKWPTVTKGWW